MAKVKKVENSEAIADQEKAQQTELQPKDTGHEQTEDVRPAEEPAQAEDIADEASFQEKDDHAQSDAGAQPSEQPSEQPVMSAEVLAYLKRHTEEEAVYIDKLGGIFSTNTPEVFRKGAVLYQNPFFKQ